MSAFAVAIILAVFAFVPLDERLARIHTAAFFSEAARVVLGIAVICALIGGFS